MYDGSGWTELSESVGFIAVFPSSMKYKIIDEGVNKNITKWNTYPDTEWTFQPGETGKDDIKFLRKVVDEVKEKYKINASRIYLNGFSNGGQMAAKCSIEMGDILAAVCSNAGSFYSDTVYQPKRKLPYLFQIGNKDYGPGNEGPEIPLIFFDSLITTPNLDIRKGRYYTIANNVVRNFSLKTEHTEIVGDTSLAVYTTYLPIDPIDKHEFKYVFVKGLGHSYPNWAPETHWQWLKKYTLLNTSSTLTSFTTELNIFPNPVQDLLFIDNNLDGVYKIYSLDGNLMLFGKGKQIDVKSLNSGLYVLNFIQDQKIFNIKFIKN